jgi:GH24 family phage-related lysozyme (muramidase)
MMQPSDEFFRLLKLFEGCKLEAYRCPANVVTIGYGSILDSKGNPFIMGTKITLADADLLLKNEVEKKANFLNKILAKTIVTQNQFDALLLFQYNCGNAALSGSTLFKKVKANPNDKSIEAEFKRWDKGGGKVLKGLTIRRATESKLYFTK